MKIDLLYIILIISYLVNSLPNQNLSPFLKYTIENLIKNEVDLICQDPFFYIEKANIEESSPLNQNQIILYHGEYYGTWIYQLILKAFLYPEAPEDWLPLRFGKLDSDIDKSTLLRLIGKNDDHHEKYTKIGLSVTPNLYSDSVGESALGSVCKFYFTNWHKISGFSDNLFDTLHHRLYGLLKEKYIPKEQWEHFKQQKKLLNYFIQEKRGLYKSNSMPEFKEKIKKYFPKTFVKYSGEFNSFVETPVITNFYHYNYEGVLLQIIMDKQMADHLVYSSHPFGWLKDDGKYSEYKPNRGNKIWENDDITPYSEVYQKVKNHKDNEQARLALNNDFRQYPSRVRIKAIAGIMKNPVDYEIVKSMIKEMVAFRHQSRE